MRAERKYLATRWGCIHEWIFENFADDDTNNDELLQRQCVLSSEIENHPRRQGYRIFMRIVISHDVGHDKADKKQSTVTEPMCRTGLFVLII